MIFCLMSIDNNTANMKICYNVFGGISMFNTPMERSIGSLRLHTKTNGIFIPDFSNYSIYFKRNRQIE